MSTDEVGITGVTSVEPQACQKVPRDPFLPSEMVEEPALEPCYQVRVGDTPHTTAARQGQLLLIKDGFVCSTSGAC